MSARREEKLNHKSVLMFPKNEQRKKIPATKPKIKKLKKKTKKGENRLKKQFADFFPFHFAMIRHRPVDETDQQKLHDKSHHLRQAYRDRRREHKTGFVFHRT